MQLRADSLGTSPTLLNSANSSDAAAILNYCTDPGPLGVDGVEKVGGEVRWGLAVGLIWQVYG
jgi:hypothetical protein